MKTKTRILRENLHESDDDEIVIMYLERHLIKVLDPLLNKRIIEDSHEIPQELELEEQ